MKNHETSLARVIILTLVAVSTVVLSVFGIAMYCLERDQVTGELESRLIVTVAQLGNSLALPLWNFDSQQVDKIIESTMRNREVYGVTVSSPGGGSLISGVVRDSRWRTVPTKEVIPSQGLLSRSQRISIHGNHVGTLQLYFTPRFQEQWLRRFSVIIVLAILTLDAFLVLILFQLLRRTVITPLKAIESYALRVSSGEEHASFVPEGYFFSELKNLGHSIVGMTRSLAEARREQVRTTVEEACDENHKILASFIEGMPVGIALTDSTGVVQHVNNRFIDLFGYDTGDIPTIEEWFLRAYPDPSRREAYLSRRKTAIDAARAAGTTVPPSESLITCRDGSERHVIVNTQFARNLRLDIFTDITEREALQNRLLNAQRLESLGVLAGGIAHDFNNILTGIMGNISMARMVLASPDTSDRLLENAEKATVRATELSSQLLTFARGGAPIKKRVKLRNIVEESLSLALRGTRVKGIVDISSCLHDIEADEGQISQVCNNIIINAVQAMPAGGSITVRGMNAVVGSEDSSGLPPGEYVKLSFTDEGCGMPENVLRKIFDPYFTTKPAGIGLGLASVHSIIKRHGGHVQVDSRIGRGTTFTLLLPSTGTAATGAESSFSPVKSEVAAAGGSVLVMDDDKVIRELASNMLEYLGYRVTTCATGEEAIQMYRMAKEGNTPFSLVITDLTVPGGKGGRESAADILALDPAARLIASSGYSNDPVMADFRDYGFCASIAKPYTLDGLLRVLQFAAGAGQTLAGGEVTAGPSA